MNSVSLPVHSVLLRYSRGEISASDAVGMLGEDASVHDVIAGLQDAGLPLPRRPRDAEAIDLARARMVLERARSAGTDPS